jgi:hypothetical protein
MFVAWELGVWRLRLTARANAFYATSLCEALATEGSGFGAYWVATFSHLGGPEMCEVALHHHPTARRFEGHVRQAIIVFHPDMYVNRSHSTALVG